MPEIKKYKTVKDGGSATFRERNSKFIGIVLACKEKENLKKQLTQIKKDHLKARHFCFGYVFGLKDQISYSSDDGEPAGSAGLPILNSIKSAELTNVAVVVVRYYGGTKLGVSGLIKAYKTAAKLALENCTFRYLESLKYFDISFEYAELHLVISALKKSRAMIVEKSLVTSPKIRISINELIAQETLQKLRADVLQITLNEFIITEPKQRITVKECNFKN